MYSIQPMGLHGWVALKNMLLAGGVPIHCLIFIVRRVRGSLFLHSITMHNFVLSFLIWVSHTLSLSYELDVDSGVCLEPEKHLRSG